MKFGKGVVIRAEGATPTYYVVIGHISEAGLDGNRVAQYRIAQLQHSMGSANVLSEERTYNASTIESWASSGGKEIYRDPMDVPSGVREFVESL